MEFDASRVFTALNADELHVGDKVIVADTLDLLKCCVKDSNPISTIRTIEPEDFMFRFAAENNGVTFALAYLVERAKTENRCATCAKSKNGGRGTCVLEEGYGCNDYEFKVEKPENCTNCVYEGSAGCSVVEICGENKLTHRCHMYEAKDTKRNLCNSCKYCFAECSATINNIVFGDGVGNDNVYECDKYEPQAVPPANCETCSKADTDRCPVPNPPKRTGCVHWESRPARVCENCRNLERHGKDNNWCEVRELKLSDEAIKKNSCGYLKLVKAEPRYRPFKDVDELVKAWEQKWSEKTNGQKWHDCKLNMPFIWVQRKGMNTQELITGFDSERVEQVQINGVWLNTQDLFNKYTFIDNTPCGVEE